MNRKMVIEIYYYTSYKTRYYWINEERKCYLRSQNSLEIKNFFVKFLSYVHSSKVKYIKDVRIWKTKKEILVRIKVSSFDLFESIMRDLVKYYNFKLISDSEGKVLAEEIMLKGNQVSCDVKDKDYRRYNEISILQGFLIIMTVLIIVILALLIKKDLMSDFVADIYGVTTFLVFILGIIFLVKEEDKVLSKIEQKEFTYLIEQVILKGFIKNFVNST